MSSGSGPILAFTGKYAFLSNFHKSLFTVTLETVNADGRRCTSRWVDVPTVEHAFQAAKVRPDTHADTYVDTILRAETPQEAKRMGQEVKLRFDWEEVKLNVMLNCLRAKFASGELAQALAATGYRGLVEGNTWGDTTWGATWWVRAVEDEPASQFPRWAWEKLRGDTVRELRGANWLGRLLMLVRSERDCGVAL